MSSGFFYFFNGEPLCHLSSGCRLLSITVGLPHSCLPVKKKKSPSPVTQINQCVEDVSSRELSFSSGQSAEITEPRNCFGRGSGALRVCLSVSRKPRRLYEALIRDVVKAQLTRHTHALAYAHRQAPAKQDTRRTHLPAGAIVANLASSAHAPYALGILCLHATRRLPFQAFTFPPISLPSLLLAHTWYILTLLFLFARSCFAVCTAFIKASGRIPAIATGPDQLGKSRIFCEVVLALKALTLPPKGWECAQPRWTARSCIGLWRKCARPLVAYSWKTAA